MWHQLEAQGSAARHLRRSIERDRVPHAYLFSGPAGAPLAGAALTLSCALNCMTAYGEACGNCEACEKAVHGVHPDIITLEREGAARIVPIETVRSQVIGRIGLLPHEAKTRVFIVEEATAMAPPAANALLKTLEEPPARTVFVLCSTAPEQLLPTIRSRCQRVRFSAGGPNLDSDAERADRIANLGAELADSRDVPDPTLPVRAAEGKGDVGPILIAAATVLHRRACAAAAQRDLRAAANASHRAQIVLSWHTAVTVHNANAQLAVEAVAAQLARIDHRPT